MSGSTDGSTAARGTREDDARGAGMRLREYRVDPERREEPTIGALVVDEARQRLGRVMAHVGTRIALRPPGGGREWDADPAYIRLAREDEILRSRMAGARTPTGRDR
ncbi:hypothetical protein [Streptomyces flavofungini]|uniref:hypothetical protein n=1 Tax=Streptomyces flavofungini TaxID=68200 RepID=UPI0034DE84F3